MACVVVWASSPSGAAWSWAPGPAPGYEVVGPHFAPPDGRVWGSDAVAPYPTGAYWLNAALGSQPVPAVPYQIAALGAGAQLSYSARRRVATQEAQVDPFGVDWFVEPSDGVGESGASLAAEAATRVAALEKVAAGSYARSRADLDASTSTSR